MDGLCMGNEAQSQVSVPHRCRKNIEKCYKVTPRTYFVVYKVSGRLVKYSVRCFCIHGQISCSTAWKWLRKIRKIQDHGILDLTPCCHCWGNCVVTISQSSTMFHAQSLGLMKKIH